MERLYLAICTYRRDIKSVINSVGFLVSSNFDTRLT